MDFGSTLKHLAPFVIPIVALLIPIIAILMRAKERMLRNQNLHETIRQISEKGLPIPEELLKAAVSDPSDQPKVSSTTSQLRSGVINICIGLGLMVFLFAVSPTAEWIWAIGAIPFIIGIGFLIIWRIELQKKPS
jgi:hypothetical protein